MWNTGGTIDLKKTLRVQLKLTLYFKYTTDPKNFESITDTKLISLGYQGTFAFKV